MRMPLPALVVDLYVVSNAQVDVVWIRVVVIFVKRRLHLHAIAGSPRIYHARMCSCVRHWAHDLRILIYRTLFI